MRKGHSAASICDAELRKNMHPHKRAGAKKGLVHELFTHLSVSPLPLTSNTRSVLWLLVREAPGCGLGCTPQSHWSGMKKESANRLSTKKGNSTWLQGVFDAAFSRALAKQRRRKQRSTLVYAQRPPDPQHNRGFLEAILRYSPQEFGYNATEWNVSLIRQVLATYYNLEVEEAVLVRRLVALGFRLYSAASFGSPTSSQPEIWVDRRSRR